MSRRDLSVKGGTSERCYRTRRGRTDEQRYAIISPYFDGRIKMNGPYPEITNISFLAKLFFKTFVSLKHLSDYRTVGLSDRRIIGLSDYSYGPISLKIGKKKLRSKMRMEQAMDRQNLYQQIMDHPNTQLFYRLINRNRNGHQSSTNCLKINVDNIFCLDEQRKCFAKYYEDLSIPNEEQFDNNFLNLCRLRQSLTDDKMDDNNFAPEQFTPLASKGPTI